MEDKKSPARTQSFSIFRAAVLGDTLGSTRAVKSPDEAAARVLKRISKQTKPNRPDG